MHQQAKETTEQNRQKKNVFKVKEIKKMKKLTMILKDESGQGMVEYGLILGLVAVAAIAALLLLGPKISTLFSTAEQAIPGAPAS